EENVTLLNAQLAKPTLFRAQRYRLFKRTQRPEESVVDYVAKLRQQAMKCKVKDNEELEDRLIDTLIFGVHKDSIRKTLLKHEDLTLKKVIDIVQTEEQATQEGAHFAKPKAEQNAVHKGNRAKVRSDENRRFERKNEDRPGSSHEPRSVNIRKTQCYRCNGSHNHRDCKFRFEYCLKSGKRGHIAKACKGTNQNKVTTVGQVKPPLFRTLNLNGKDVKFQVDTGATRTIIPPSVYENADALSRL